MTDFAETKARFDLPDGVVYLDGNSLGPLPRGVAERVQRCVASEWGEGLIRSWNRAGWMELPRKVGDRIAKLIGAPAGSVTMGDTLSIKVYQAVASALLLRPQRRVILSDRGNFPTDLYMAEGLARLLGDGYELRLVEPYAVEAALDESVALLMLTQVDYRSGRLHDMRALTRRAHEVGALACWDLAHSAGALPVQLEVCQVDFAVGCTYKYLNGGPGAPAFIYIRPDLVDQCRPALSGWLGHEAPFEFDLEYRAAAGIERMRVGTPPILGLVALDAALEIWEGVDLQALRARSIELSERFLAGVEARCPQLSLASPRDPLARGSQLAFAFDEGYAVIQALIAEGVIGDFRAPNLLRFGFTPLYLDENDVDRALDVLERVLSERLWDQPRFKTRAAVT